MSSTRLKHNEGIRLEHKRQVVAPVRVFIVRMVKYFLFAISLIAMSIAIGTFGYHHLGNLNWIDSFHMSCMILTGMGPVNEMKSDAAKLFSSFYALYSGVAFLTIIAVFLSPVVHRILHILHVESED